MIKRFLGALSGVVIAELCMQIDDAIAMSLSATKMAGCFDIVSTAGAILLAIETLMKTKPL